MVSLQKVKTLEVENRTKVKSEMADAHCHLDMLTKAVVTAAIAHGVGTMITDGGSTKSNMRALELWDGSHVFPALGVDPQFAAMGDEELGFNIGMIRANRDKIVGIGEIGLDYKIVSNFDVAARQKAVFERFIDLGMELGLPLSIHARDALDEVMTTLREKGAEKVHLHFFEGGEVHAKRAEKLGYMISVPPVKSARRMKAIRAISLENLMVESDAPACGKTPEDVALALGIIAEAKGISFEGAAEATALNTKRFFNIYRKTGFMRI